MLVFFGTSGDLGYLRQLMAAAGFRVEVVATDSLLRDETRIDYFTFRVA